MGKMTDEERDKLLSSTEIMLMRNKEGCSENSKRHQYYGVAIVAVGRDRAYELRDYDKETLTDICLCGRVTDIVDGEFYCKYCGQRLKGYVSKI